jgi:hypothetical protein
MEIQPRIRTVPKPGATLYNPSVPNATVQENIKSIHSPKKQKSDDPSQENNVSSENSQDEDKQEKKGFFKSYSIIIIFAIIIIVLIVVIVWLVGKNDKYMGWMRFGKNLPPMRAPLHPSFNTHTPTIKETPQTAQKMTHQDVVKSATMDELEKFANLDIKSDVQIVVVDEPVENKETEQQIVDLEETEHKLNAKLDTMASDTNDVAPSQAIDEAINDEVLKIEYEQNRPVEQFNLKTGATIAVFKSHDEMYKANFDPEQVIAVCRGDQKSHKKYGWKYCDESQ